MGSVLLVLQLIVAIFLVVVILLQRSNGGALSGLGGDSSIGGLLSARGKGNILTRITAVLATLFFALSMALSIYFSRMEVKSSSIIDNAVISSELPTSDKNAAQKDDTAATATQESTEPAPEAEASEPDVPTAE